MLVLRVLLGGYLALVLLSTALSIVVDAIRDAHRGLR
jgi:hypothetical protein